MARGHSARAIARELGLARNTVLRYLHSPEAMLPKPRAARGLLLDPYTEHIDRRMAQGLENCIVLLRASAFSGHTECRLRCRWLAVVVEAQVSIVPSAGIGRRGLWEWPGNIAASTLRGDRLRDLPGQ